MKLSEYQAEVRNSAKRIKPKRLPKDLPDTAKKVRYERPKTRADCEEGIRPCPFVGCRHHLYLDVDKEGEIIINFPDKEPTDLIDSCVLDVVDEIGCHSYEEISEKINLVGTTCLKIEAVAVEKIKKRLEGKNG